MATAGGGGGPVLYSLEAEEALVAALLLMNDPAPLERITDDDIWYDHIRPIVATARRLHQQGKPMLLEFVVYALGDELGSLSWRGLRGRDLVLDIAHRGIHDMHSWFPIPIANLLHHYAEQRRGLKRAQRAAVRTFKSTFERKHSGGVVIP